MTVTPVNFHSEGCRLVGDLYAPEDLGPGERRAGIVLCHGYTGVKDLYLPDNARVLVEAGYAVLAFDYKGWGESEGPRTRLAPWSRVADVQAALTFLGAQEAVDESRLGIYGTSYGGATVVWTGAIDRRVRCEKPSPGSGSTCRPRDGRGICHAARTPPEERSWRMRAGGNGTGEDSPGITAKRRDSHRLRRSDCRRRTRPPESSHSQVDCRAAPPPRQTRPARDS